MPTLKIVASKKITAIVTIEEATAQQIDLYAAWTNVTADEVVQAALNHVFTNDKDFAKYSEEHATAKPSIPLRLKKPASTSPKPEHDLSIARRLTSAAR